MWCTYNYKGVLFLINIISSNKQYYLPYGTWFEDLCVNVICVQEGSIYLKDGNVC